jgi:ribonuclease E
MSRKMLIDAAHPEETRVVVVENNRVEEFDFEAASRKPIRGNIYLAKVTRVEPSLQAAFVEYGGNKHGFLAFNEIHPDYYQIPTADREALRAQEAEITGDLTDDAPDTDGDDDVETPVADEDDLVDEASRRRRNFMRKYKIQEVIKRRQVLLVQVAKEERGNKGAALTTYLSLAGRYCVLMPNTARGGGISRKITSATDRKRLKSAVSELSVPGGMGLIIRTAGASRTKVEIKRDYDYLIRLWETIRTLTLESSAPSLIYEEGNLVKRVIRDLYDKDIDEVLVDGEPAYKEAKAFMKMLMPSHAKKVQHYKDNTPLFLRHQVESQLEAIHSPTAQLKSGGYIVINPTEALVSIDVNSGKSTKERNIEQTALRTNLEAAEEAARQMRLRDLAGLLVLDFIDMDENKNVRAVEKKMKDALKRDRARIQVGRISQFGLMEMSRQRRRTSLVEGSADICPHCQGNGHIRSIESSALVALRTVEEEGVRGRAAHVRLSCSPEVALYVLNEKRDHLNDIETRYELRVTVNADDSLKRPACQLERLETRREAARAEALAQEEAAPLSAGVDALEAVETADEPDEDRRTEDNRTEDGGLDESGGRKRRRRGRRGGRNRRRRDEAGGEDNRADGEASADSSDEGSGNDILPVVNPTGGDSFTASDDGEAEDKPKRRRSRRRRKSDPDAEAAPDNAETSPEASTDGSAETETASPVEPASEGEDQPKPKRRRRRKTEPKDEPAEVKAADAENVSEPESAAEAPAAEDTPKPTRRVRRKKADAEAPADADAKAEPARAEAEAEPEAEAEKPKPKRTRKPKAKAEPKDEPEAEAAKPEPATSPEPEAPGESAKAQDEPAKAGATNTATDNEKGEDGEDRPRKKGWWQRSGKFLGLN